MERHAIQESVGGNYVRGSMFVCVLMAAISFDGTLPVCSCAYVNICGWKGALLKSFFCLNVWAGFCMCLSVYWRICQKRLRVTEEGGKSQVTTWRHQHLFYTSLSTMPPIYLSFLHDNMITLCTCWLQSACCQLTPEPMVSQCCKQQLLIVVIIFATVAANVQIHVSGSVIIFQNVLRLYIDACKWLISKC